MEVDVVDVVVVEDVEVVVLDVVAGSVVLVVEVVDVVVVGGKYNVRIIENKVKDRMNTTPRKVSIFAISYRIISF